jgi:ribosomal protein S18 acetylase RimI-like enzyme
VTGASAEVAKPKIVRASPVVARRQAAWIAGIEPWRGLGYRAAPLGRYLARAARAGEVWVARAAGRDPLGIVVVTDGFLLGGFIALLAVAPEASGKGTGQLLVAHVEARVFARRRWLFVSCDADNRGALRFYRRQGFARVGRLPDLVRAGRIEVLLRKPRGASR